MPVTSSARSGSGAANAPVEIKTGWAYIVRPPMWPIGNTPGQRGGVRVASTVPAVHVVLTAEAGTERIFFLGGRDHSGDIAPCTLTVESIDAGGAAPQSVDVTAGWYVERKHDPLSNTPSKLVQLRYDTLPDSHPIRLFLASITPGSGSSGGSSGS